MSDKDKERVRAAVCYKLMSVPPDVRDGIRYSVTRALTAMYLRGKAMNFPKDIPSDILSRADELLSAKYGTDRPIDPEIVELVCRGMMEERGDWRPIDTCKKGDWVLGYEPSQGVCVCALMEPGGWVMDAPWNGEEVWYEMYREPTHWRPLPPLPIAKAIRGTE